MISGEKALRAVAQYGMTIEVSHGLNEVSVWQSRIPVVVMPISVLDYSSPSCPDSCDDCIHRIKCTWSLELPVIERSDYEALTAAINVAIGQIEAQIAEEQA